MKIGIVGFGKMGMLHGALANSIDGVEVVAICDNSRIILSAFKSVMPKIKTFLSHEKMFASCALDAVIITTPVFNHFDVAMSAARNGIAVFVEKPLAVNYYQAKTLLDELEQYSIKSFVAFCSRFNPVIAKGRSLYLSGLCGEVLSVKCANYCGDVMKKSNGWRYNKTLSGGGVLIDFGIHMIDLAVWYFGGIDYVKVSSKKIYSKNVEDEVVADIIFQNGKTVQFETSWSRPQHRKPAPMIEIRGSAASLIITDQQISILRKDSIETISYADVYEGHLLDIGGINFSYQMKAFINLLNGSTTQLGADYGVYIQSVIDAMYASAHNNSIQKVDYLYND